MTNTGIFVYDEFLDEGTADLHERMYDLIHTKGDILVADISQLISEIVGWIINEGHAPRGMHVLFRRYFFLQSLQILKCIN